jgi:hypothetical protein
VIDGIHFSLGNGARYGLMRNYVLCANGIMRMAGYLQIAVVEARGMLEVRLARNVL